VDAWRTPKRVLLAHPLDQIAQVTINLRSPCPIPRLPAPKRSEACPMPAQDRLGPHHLHRIEQIRPKPNHPNQQDPIDAAQPKPPRRLSQCNVQLVTKKQILNFKPAAGLEQVGDKRCERRQHRKHRPQRCNDSALRRESKPGCDFRKGHRLFKNNPLGMFAPTNPDVSCKGYDFSLLEKPTKMMHGP
jgi:hypothetical protein